MTPAGIGATTAYHPSVDPLPERCANCGAALVGEYCAQCGQQVRAPDPTARELAQEAFEELTSVDGKLLRTLRALLLEPGRLTLEYIAGRRVQYVAPLKLYLWLSVLYFFASALVPNQRPVVRMTGDVWTKAERAARDAARDRVLASAPDPATRARLADSLAQARARDSLAVVTERAAALDSVARLIAADTTRLASARTIGAGLKRAAAHEDEFAAEVNEWIPRAVFALVPVFALLLAVVYRSRRVRYPRHLFFAFHFHAFVFLALLVLAVSQFIPDPRVRAPLGIVALLAVPAYGVMALRRVYGGSVRGAMARATLVALLYLPAFAVAMAIAFLIAAATF